MTMYTGVYFFPGHSVEWVQVASAVARVKVKRRSQLKIILCTKNTRRTFTTDCCCLSHQPTVQQTCLLTAFPFVSTVLGCRWREWATAWKSATLWPSSDMTWHDMTHAIMFTPVAVGTTVTLHSALQCIATANCHSTI